MADDILPGKPEDSADNLIQPSPADAQTDFQSEISRPMLDVHAPNETIHTWKDFLNHIAAIVVGLLIAVGLEQTVEFFHHRHQREQLVEAIRRDGEANRGYIKDDIAVARGVLDWALGQAAALERAGATGPLILRRMPKGIIGSLDAGVWLSAKASGVTNLLPPSAQNWLEYLADEYHETFGSSASSSGKLYMAYAALDQVTIGHAIENSSGEIEISALDAAQRLNVVECLRTIAEHAREVVRTLVIDDAGNEFILSTPLDQLDTPEAGKRYLQIYAEKMRAQPAANFTFSSH
jgi:hypothetical protein